MLLSGSSARRHRNPHLHMDWKTLSKIADTAGKNKSTSIVLIVFGIGLGAQWQGLNARLDSIETRLASIERNLAVNAVTNVIEQYHVSQRR